jgi:putative endonuclease
MVNGLKDDTKHNQKVGRWGEQVAADYLEGRGYLILHRNFRTGHGELDLIASHDGQLIFVEVKTRTNTSAGYPEQALTPKKAAHLLESAETYLAEHPDAPVDWKIEVVAVTGKPGSFQIELFDEVSYGE